MIKKDYALPFGKEPEPTMLKKILDALIATACLFMVSLILLIALVGMSS